jgi:hypothetical protein
MHRLVWEWIDHATDKVVAIVLSHTAQVVVVVLACIYRSTTVREGRARGLLTYQLAGGIIVVILVNGSRRACANCYALAIADIADVGDIADGIGVSHKGLLVKPI